MAFLPAALWRMEAKSVGETSHTPCRSGWLRVALPVHLPHLCAPCDLGLLCPALLRLPGGDSPSGREGGSLLTFFLFHFVFVSFHFYRR